MPLDLDPNRPIRLPSRLRTLSVLIAETLAALVRLPLFLVPLLFHAPAYFFGRVGAKLVEDEEETQAQNKVAFGLLLLLVIYTSVGIFIWSMLSFTAFGALLATSIVFIFSWYHNSLIDGESPNRNTWRQTRSNVGYHYDRVLRPVRLPPV